MNGRSSGFTLLELVIAVTIVGILAAIAVPSYQMYARKAKRTAAQRVLLDIANRQERFYLDNRTYTTNLTSLGFAASPAHVDSDGREVTAADAKRIYLIAVSAADAGSYTLQATAELGQGKDTSCSVLTVNQAGQKTPSGCW